MKTTFLTGFLLMCACTLAAQSQPNTKTISVEVSNSWIKDKADAPVVLKIKDLQPGFRVRSAVVMNGSEEIPSQLDDLNGDLKADEVAFVIHRARCLPIFLPFWGLPSAGGYAILFHRLVYFNYKHWLDVSNEIPHDNTPLPSASRRACIERGCHGRRKQISGDRGPEKGLRQR